MWAAASTPWYGGECATFQSPMATARGQIAPSAARGSVRPAPATCLALVRSAEERERRAQQDPHIDGGRTVLDVPEVELDPLGPRQLGASVDLGPPGEAWCHLEPASLARVVTLDLIAEG